MRRALPAAAAVLALALRAGATPPCALVWLPAPDFRDWDRVDAVLDARPSLKLTIGLTPDMAPAARKRLARWVAAGCVEAAARAPGDPSLALVAAHPAAPRPEDALEAAAGARAALEKALGPPVAGFLPGGGALTPSLVGPLGAAGAAWVLAGPYAAADAAWAAEGPAAFVPGRAAGARPTPESLTQAGAVVSDESAGGGDFLSALAALPWTARPVAGWATVSELVRGARPAPIPAADVALWPGWDGAAPAAPEDPAGRAAWQAYGDAARTLALYQNSGSADLGVLERAIALLRRAQEARFFYPDASVPRPQDRGLDAIWLSSDASVPRPRDRGLDDELRGRLLAVYKQLKASAPDALYASAVSGQAAADAERSSDVRASSGSGWLAFDNPAASTAAAPGGAPDAEPWRLQSLRVEWDDERLLLRLTPGRVAASTETPRPIYDVYVDLNHVSGAGSIALLEGRGVFVPAEDAWEYALSISAGGARLWRAAPGGPEELSPLDLEEDPARGELRASLPRAALRGNPARWGYLVLALAEDPAKTGLSPAAPLAGPRAAAALGVLAPLDVQRAVLERRGGPPRAPASRLP